MERLPGVVVGVQGVAEHLVDELGLVLVKGERGDGVEVLGRHAVRLVVVQQRRHLLLRLGGASGSSESTAAAGTSSCSSCRSVVLVVLVLVAGALDLPCATKDGPRNRIGWVGGSEGWKRRGCR